MPLKDPEARKAYQAEYRRKNKERLAAYDKERYAANPEKQKQTARKWVKANPERRREISKKHISRNRDYYNAAENKRRAAKLQRTTEWCGDVETPYKLAKLCEKSSFSGYKYHVDHVIPLQGDIVSGLHTQQNLRIIRAEENLAKSNKFRSDQCL